MPLPWRQKPLLRAPSGRIDEETTCNIGTITGGRATNIIPELCVVEAEARSRDEGKLEKLLVKLWPLLKMPPGHFLPAHWNRKVEEYDAFRIEETAPLMNLFRMACKEAGFAVKTAPCGGGSDANFFCSERISFPSWSVWE